MSLDHAILGFLQYGPLSGYDLKAAFDSSVRHFWPADQSQIYRVLSRLAESNLTGVEVVEQEEKPDKKVYHITEEGRKELHRWLTTPLPEKGEHVAELVQVFFAGSLSDVEALDLFKRLADRIQSQLALLCSIPVKQDGCKASDDNYARDRFFRLLTLEYGMRMTEWNLNWAQSVIMRLEKGDYSLDLMKGESNENPGN